ncbi:MAG: hypothetical protein KGZ65_00880 [Sphingomonadales bacterium]|nr:hypothetical protein [Sphingomonadaceae bacterium]MBS3929759.1 hypothetical protein [Sphingomonadales bacterium]
MPKHECFAFFCEDFRHEVGGKTSYMGVLGPKIDFGQESAEVPPDTREVMAKIVAVAMIRTNQRQNINLLAELIIENGPDDVIKYLKSEHLLEVEEDQEETLIQFNAQLPNVPAHAGMKITVKFDADGCLFEASLLLMRS